MQTELFKIGLVPVSLIDLLDIAAVTLIFYRAYLVIQGTTASRMLTGLIFILIVSVVVHALNMNGMIWLTDQIRQVHQASNGTYGGRRCTPSSPSAAGSPSGTTRWGCSWLAPASRV